MSPLSLFALISLSTHHRFAAGARNGHGGAAGGQIHYHPSRIRRWQVSIRRWRSPDPAVLRASASPRHGLQSFHAVAAGVLAYLRAAGVAVLPGLSDAELARAEAEFGFAFPHDLRAVLGLGMPSGLGFPDWRGRAGLYAAFDLTAAADPHEAG